MSLKYYKEAEFRGYYHRIEVMTLLGADAFRHLWGAPVEVSPAPGAILRNLGPDNTSGHNEDRWGKSLALDLMPHGMDTAEDRQRAVEIATTVGFIGIGVYPDWKPRPGLHLDMKRREGRGFGNPGTWSAFRNPETGEQEYFDLAKAL